MIKKYIKKPIPVEAIQWTDNTLEVQNFCDNKCNHEVSAYTEECLYITTLEGIMRAKRGDYIIKGVRGEFYPCKEVIFKETYEEVKP